MENESHGREWLSVNVQRRPTPSSNTVKVAESQDKEGNETLDLSGERSRLGSEGEASTSSSAFHTPGSGSSNESITETGFLTPLPTGSVSTSQRTCKIVEDVFSKELETQSHVTKRPLRQNFANWRENSEDQNVPSKVKSSEVRVTGETHLHSAIRDLGIADQRDLFRRLGIDIGPRSGPQTSSTTNTSQNTTATETSVPKWKPSSVSRMKPPTSSSSLEVHKEKSSSPSGLSQSSVVSGMEWDPSADVELGTTHYEQVPPPPSNKSESLSLGTIPPNSERSGSHHISSEDHGSGLSELDTSRQVPGASSWKDSVSIEINLDPKKRTTQPRSKSELGNNAVLVVDRSVQADSSILKSSTSLSNGSASLPVDKSYDSRGSKSHSNRNRSSKASSHSRVGALRHAGREVSSSGEMSSELTPTCSFIKQLTSSGVPIKDANFLQAIYTHRQEHIGNVKRELKRIQVLSQILCGRSNEDSTSLSLSSSSSKEHSPATNTTSSKKLVQESRASCSRQPISPERRKRCECTKQNRDVPKTANTQPVSKNVSVIAEQTENDKVEEIMTAFRQLLENFVPGGTKTHSSSSDVVFLPDFNKEAEKISKSKVVGKVKSKSAPVKPPVSYFLPVPSGRQRYGFPPKYERSRSSSDKENEGEMDGLEPSPANINIQKVLAENHPEFVKKANERRALLAGVRDVRQKRAQLTRNWIATYGTDDLSALESALPTKGPRLMSTKEMRKQAVEKYRTLPEIQEKKLQRKVQKEKETNRLLSSYFSGKLRQGVLKGRVNVDLNRSVIRK